MAETNGSKVTTKAFYEELLRQNDARVQMERRLSDTISSATDRLESRIIKQVDDQKKEIDCIHAGLDDLRASDRRITYLSAIIAAVFAATAGMIDWMRH